MPLDTNFIIDIKSVSRKQATIKVNLPLSNTSVCVELGL